MIDREPQPFDTIGKGGNYWRITEIDEKGSVTAWRIFNGTVYKKGRPLRINVQKILDGTYRLLDIPPVRVTSISEIEKEKTEVEYKTEYLTEEKTEEKTEVEKMTEELERLREECKTLKQDVDVWKYRAQNAEKERAKAEGHADGLMVALTLLTSKGEGEEK